MTKMIHKCVDIVLLNNNLKDLIRVLENFSSELEVRHTKCDVDIS